MIPKLTASRRSGRRRRSSCGPTGQFPMNGLAQVMGALNAGGFNEIGLVTDGEGPSFGAGARRIPETTAAEADGDAVPDGDGCIGDRARGGDPLGAGRRLAVRVLTAGGGHRDLGFHDQFRGVRRAAGGATPTPAEEPAPVRPQARPEPAVEPELRPNRNPHPNRSQFPNLHLSRNCPAPEPEPLPQPEPVPVEEPPPSDVPQAVEEQAIQSESTEIQPAPEAEEIIAPDPVQPETEAETSDTPEPAVSEDPVADEVTSRSRPRRRCRGYRGRDADEANEEQDAETGMTTSIRPRSKPSRPEPQPQPEPEVAADEQPAEQPAESAELNVQPVGRFPGRRMPSTRF